MDICSNINSGWKTQTKVQHLKSVSNFLVVNIPTEKVFIRDARIGSDVTWIHMYV